jgi:hypothetical protein
MDVIKNAGRRSAIMSKVEDILASTKVGDVLDAALDVPDAEAKRVMYGQSPTSPTIRQENFMKHIILCLRNIIRKKREKK